MLPMVRKRKSRGRLEDESLHEPTDIINAVMILGIGTTGINIVPLVWKNICDIITEHKELGGMKKLRISRFASEIEGKMRPHILLIDTSEEEAMYHKFTQLDLPEDLSVPEENCISIYVRGGGLGKNVFLGLNHAKESRLRLVADTISSFFGGSFPMTIITVRSLGGGTGAGFGSVLIKYIKDISPETYVIDFAVIPELARIKTYQAEFFNFIFSYLLSFNFADAIFPLSNTKLDYYVKNVLGKYQEGYELTNQLIADIIVALLKPILLGSDFDTRDVNLFISDTDEAKLWHVFYVREDNVRDPDADFLRDIVDRNMSLTSIMSIPILPEYGMENLLGSIESWHMFMNVESVPISVSLINDIFRIMRELHNVKTYPRLVVSDKDFGSRRSLELISFISSSALDSVFHQEHLNPYMSARQRLNAFAKKIRVMKDRIIKTLRETMKYSVSADMRKEHLIKLARKIIRRQIRVIINRIFTDNYGRYERIYGHVRDILGGLGIDPGEDFFDLFLDSDGFVYQNVITIITPPTPLPFESEAIEEVPAEVEAEIPSLDEEEIDKILEEEIGKLL